jgi:hypothetical protein
VGGLGRVRGQLLVPHEIDQLAPAPFGFDEGVRDSDQLGGAGHCQFEAA